MTALSNAPGTITRTIIDQDTDGTTGMITTTATITTGIMARGTTHGDHLHAGITGGTDTQPSPHLD